MKLFKQNIYYYFIIAFPGVHKNQIDVLMYKFYNKKLSHINIDKGMGQGGGILNIKI